MQRTGRLVAAAAAVLAACLSASGGTIAYWRFEEGADGYGALGPMPGTAGHVVSQVNSPALDGTRAAGAALYVGDVPGPFVDGVGANNRALCFDGDDAWYVLDNALLNFGSAGSSGDFTIEFFARVNPVPNNGRTYRFVQKRGHTGGTSLVGYDTWLYTGADSSSYVGQANLLIKDPIGEFSPDQVRSGMRIDDGVWHHLAFQRTAANRLRIWVDYQLRADKASTETGSLVNAYDLWVGRGRTQGDQDYLVGWMDEIRISDEAIPPEQFLHVIPEPATAIALVAAATLGCSRALRGANTRTRSLRCGRCSRRPGRSR